MALIYDMVLLLAALGLAFLCGKFKEVEAEWSLHLGHGLPLRAHLGGLDDHVPLRQRPGYDREMPGQAPP